MPADRENLEAARAAIAPRPGVDFALYSRVLDERDRYRQEANRLRERLGESKGAQQLLDALYQEMEGAACDAVYSGAATRTRVRRMTRPHRFDPSYVHWSRCVVCGKHKLNSLHDVR